MDRFKYLILAISIFACAHSGQAVSKTVETNCIYTLICGETAQYTTIPRIQYSGYKTDVHLSHTIKNWPPFNLKPRTTASGFTKNLGSTLKLESSTCKTNSSRKEITLISARTDQDITKAMMDDPMQRALVQIQGVFSELEKNLLVKKLRISRELKKAETGKCEGRKSYKEIAPQTVAYIRKLRRKPKGMTKRKSYRQIAEILNGEKIPTLNGQLWTLQTVKNAIK